MTGIPAHRIRSVVQHDLRSDGDYVLYWLVANRRGTHNFSLQYAVEWAKQLAKPLVLFEPLWLDDPWTTDRHYQFVLEGMVDNERCFAEKPVTYYPYLELEQGRGKGLIEALAKNACLVISDDSPCFFSPQVLESVTSEISVRFELVDSNGLLPMRSSERVFSRAFDFRRYLQKNLREHLNDFPLSDPLAVGGIPPKVSLRPLIYRQWPIADLKPYARSKACLGKLSIDHGVGVLPIRGGAHAAGQLLQAFVQHKLERYLEVRNQPEENVSSGLSPYLHFGHISVHQVFLETVKHAGWDPGHLSEHVNGRATGWWGLHDAVESFLDQLITWRELGYNFCAFCPDYDQFETLPSWAQQTLEAHAGDPRPHVYSLGELENAGTHDPLWNAAQRQLRSEGRIHNYLRMLWGKKILKWSSSPRQALSRMIELNNKYALDGHNPNSYSGIGWVLGRYDRAWGPERQIFGKVRYMTSRNTARKVRVKHYLQRYASHDQ